MNTNYPTQKFFIESPGPLTMGVYTDKDTVKKFILKERGIEVSGGSTASWSKVETQSAVKKIVALSLTRTYTAAAIDYGIKVVTKRKNLGSIDNSETIDWGKTYGGRITGLTDAPGTYQIDKAIAQEDEIISLITGDTNNKQFDTSTPTGAIVRARRAYVIVDADHTDASGFTVTKADGTTYAFASAAAVTFSGTTHTNTTIDGITDADNAKYNEGDIISGSGIASGTVILIKNNEGSNSNSITVSLATTASATVTITIGAFADGQLARQFNANTNVNTILKMYWIDADTYLLTSINAGYDYSIGTLVDATVTRREILLDNLYDDISFNVEYDSDWATETSYYLADLTSSDSFAAAVNGLFYRNGALVGTCTTGTNISVVTDVIAAYTGLNAVFHDSTILIAGIESTCTGLDIQFPYYAGTYDSPYTATAPYTTNASISYMASPKGRFSSLTADDVQRIFATVEHAGDLLFAIRRTVTTAGAEYVKFTLNPKQLSVDAIHGASHVNSYQTKIELYIPKSVLRADIFDATDLSADVLPGSADNTINELLAFWIL